VALPIATIPYQMANPASLFQSNDNSLWGAALEAYSPVIQKKAAEKGKSSKSKTKELLELDNWYVDYRCVVEHF